MSESPGPPWINESYLLLRQILSHHILAGVAMEEWVFSDSSAEATMVNQVGGGLVGERAPRLGPEAFDDEIVGLSAMGDRAGAFTFFLPGAGAGLVAGTGAGGDARGASGGVAEGEVFGGGVAEGGDVGGGDAEGGVAGGGVARGGVAGGEMARGEEAGDGELIGGGVARGGDEGGRVLTGGGVDGGKKSLTFLSSLKLKIWCFRCKQFLYNFYILAKVSFFYWVAENMSFLPRPNRRYPYNDIQQ